MFYYLIHVYINCRFIFGVGISSKQKITSNRLVQIPNKTQSSNEKVTVLTAPVFYFQPAQLYTTLYWPKWENIEVKL